MANFHMASVRLRHAPLHPEKLLFANDLVYCVMKKKFPQCQALVRDLNGSATYRDQIFNAFNGVIVRAVEMLADRLSDTVASRFQEYVRNNNNIVVSTSFESYAHEYRREYAVGGEINLRVMFKYFVTLALLAGHYHVEGVTEARGIATNMIVLELPTDWFSDSTYWDKLAEVANKIVGNVNEEEPTTSRNMNLIEYQEH